MRSSHNRLAKLLVPIGFAGVALVTTTSSHAQQAGTTNGPIPNVLVIVDNSGSMERNTDNSLPTCNGGTGPMAQPNRWGRERQ